MKAKDFNKNVSHPLQSLEWEEFRKKTGVKTVRGNNFLVTIHTIPHLPYTIGYFPKGLLPTQKMIEELIKIGKKEKCIFIQLEPNVIKDSRLMIKDSRLKPAAHPLFTKYTFILDLIKSEDDLLKNMHAKTRYNIRVAQKHNVEVSEDNSDKAFEEYLKLTKETTSRQGFYAHTENYHRLMWQTLKTTNSLQSTDYSKLTAHLLIAKYNPETKDERPKTLVAWVLFVFKDTLYYPYGASSTEHRETMASNLMMWEAIRFGKKLGLKKFDMWGALGPEPDPKDPWFGFHRFKQGYGPRHVEFAGSFDLVINPVLYQIYKVADKLRWFYLKLKNDAA